MVRTSVCYSNSIVSSIFSLEFHNRGEKKLTNNYIKIKRFFQDKIYLFIDFVEKLEMMHIEGGGGVGGGACYLRHCDALLTKIDM